MGDWKLPLKLRLLDGQRVRSFVTRQGRLTKGQRLALDELWPKVGLDIGAGELAKVMPDAKARVLEIGFGNGESLAAMALAQPDVLFIGVEVHQPGVGALLQLIQDNDIQNIRLFYADARDVFATEILDESLDRVQVYFPDPWPKKRHHKRRIIQQEFVQMILPKVKVGGHIHTATDWEPYAKHMLEVLTSELALENTYEGATPERPAYRPETKFERRGQGLGHGVWDFVFTKRDTVRSASDATKTQGD